MKMRLKLFLFLIIEGILLIPFLAMPSVALADGMVISKPDPYADRWDYLGESNQQAFINYEDGLEKMILSIGMEETSKDAVWIFPVPAEPSKVVVDVVTKLPKLGGEEITRKAKLNLSNIKRVLSATQIYTIPFIFLWGQFDFYPVPQVVPYGALGESRAGNGGERKEVDVIVYEHLEKEGITSEIITAKTAQALYQYFQEKGLAVEQGSIPVLDHYIGKEFTFIVSWITEKAPVLLSPAEIEENLLYYLKNHHDYSKVGESFDEQISIYFPELFNYLSISGEEAYRYLQDNPEIKEMLVNYLSQNQNLITPYSQRGEEKQDNPEFEKMPVNYLFQNFDPVAPFPQQQKVKQRGVLVTFPTKKIYYPLLPTSVYESKKIPATIRIVGHTSPEIFKDIESYANTEYYIDESVVLEDELESFYNGPTKNVKYTKIKINAPSKLLTDDLWINPRPPLKTYFSSFFAEHSSLVTILLLILSSISGGIIAGLVVFNNLRNKKGMVKLGLIGLANCLSLMGVVMTTWLVGTKPTEEKMAPLLSEIKQKGYIGKRRVTSFLLAVGISLPTVTLIGLLSFAGELLNLFGTSYFYTFRWATLIALVVLITGLVFFLISSKVKPEDKPLFAQLKSAGYSSWSFRPKDKRKFLFVPLFSVVFVEIALLVVQLVEWAV